MASKLIAKVEEIMRTNTKVHAYKSDDYSIAYAKKYVEDNESLINGMFKHCFDKVWIGKDNKLYFRTKPLVHKFIDTSYEIGHLELCFDNDGRVDFVGRDPKIFRHSHIRFDGREKAGVSCWGEITPPEKQIYIEGFVHALTDLIQFMSRSDSTQHDESELEIQG